MWYLDSSAFLKLLVREPESEDLRAWYQDHDRCWSSALLVTEVLRAAARLELDPGVVDATLDALSLVHPSSATFRRAGQLQPPTLRSLDALHLATAMELGPDLDGLVTYDQRMATGAASLQLGVLAPGR